MRRLTAAAVALALGASILAGCTPAPTALSPQVSTDMQSAVVAVAESAAAGDPTTALARLDELQQRLDAALAAGDVTQERAAAIQSAIDAVRAGLQPTPAPTVEPAPAPATTVDPGVTDDGGNDNSGPGNNNGNGDDDDKGKGKGKDG